MEKVCMPLAVLKIKGNRNCFSFSTRSCPRLRSPGPLALLSLAPTLAQQLFGATVLCRWKTPCVMSTQGATWWHGHGWSPLPVRETWNNPKNGGLVNVSNFFGVQYPFSRHAPTTPNFQYFPGSIAMRGWHLFWVERYLNQNTVAASPIQSFFNPHHQTVFPLWNE